MVMMSLEDTELSCVAGLSQGYSKEISDFSLLLYKYNGLSEVPVLYVNTCSAVQRPSAGSTLPSSEVFGFLGDPGRHVETVSSGVAAWHLPP